MVCNMFAHRRRKRTTDELLNLDVRFLARDGYIVPGRSRPVFWNSKRTGERVGMIHVTCETRELLTLEYRVREGGDDWEKVVAPVHLTWTSCHFGGERPWFSCPGCFRRCGKVTHGGWS